MTRLEILYPELPTVIQTADCGKATIGVVVSQNAEREYTCPLCDDLIEIREQHILAVPIDAVTLRRHIHSDCIISHLKYGMSIRLHPKEPNAMKYHTESG